jgi:hypothetical protein
LVNAVINSECVFDLWLWVLITTKCTWEVFEEKYNGACLDEINIVCSKVEIIHRCIFYTKAKHPPCFHFVRGDHIFSFLHLPLCSYCRENLFVIVFCKLRQLSCFCTFHSCLLKTCYNQFSQTSSNNCVLNFRSWSAKCVTSHLNY